MIWVYVICGVIVIQMTECDYWMRLSFSYNIPVVIIIATYIILIIICTIICIITIANFIITNTTFHHLTAAGTDNAVSQLRSFGVHYLLELIPAADPAATALEVIKGSATRQQEVYYPYLEARLTTLMRHLAPDVLAAFNRYLFSKP